ncbi:MAG: serine/threonine protein kinase [Archangium sp.]|nr:serine/threonine protein kinase [Archangium sp.]
MNLAHPDDSQLAEFAQGDLTGQPLSDVEGHVAQCGDCRGLVAQLIKVLAPEEAHGPHKGLVVGRYVVLDAVGAGALGEVFSAWDSTLERTVALKWLYPSVAGKDRDSLRQRLVAEARALARVQHPNVVSVHDVLAHEGADVIVMELVQHARSLRVVLDGTGPWQRTVAHFIAAADGLVAAHAAGVIHRDFKPDNVLLDGAGRVVVVDFGLARQTDLEAPAGTTSKHSTVSGTPAYLAPERWQGRAADEASDQFSFCVSLYECLTGKLPFLATDLAGRLDDIRRGPLPMPEVNERVVAALRRGLSTEPSARWPSMAALRDELRASLDAPKRRQVYAVGAALLALSGGIFLLGVRQIRTRCDAADAPVRAVWTTARRATVTSAFEATRHPAATALATRVVQAVDDAVESLASTRKRACVATTFEGDSDALLSARQTCVSRRLSDIDALLRGLEAADGKAVERAVVAVESLAPASDCLEASLSATDPMPSGPARAAVDTAITRVATVRAMRLLGKTKDSVALAETVVSEARAAGWRPLTSDALLEWGSGLERLSKYDDARAKQVEALELAVTSRDDKQAFAAAVALAYLDGVDRKQTESGGTWLTLGNALSEPARVQGTTEAIRLANVQAVMLMRADKAAEAAVLLARLEQELTKVGQLETVNGARLITNLSAALRESGKPTEGVEAAKRSLALMEKVLSPNHPDVAAAVNNLGSALADLGRLDEAAPFFQRAVELRERLFGKDALVLATPHYNLGELAFRRGDGKTALEAYGRARAIVENARGPDEDDVWDARMGEGLALGLLGRHAEAIAELERVVPELEKRKLPAWNIAQAKLGLAQSLRALKKDEPRVVSLLNDVKALPGPRHDAQRAKAEALLAR